MPYRSPQCPSRRVQVLATFLLCSALLPATPSGATNQDDEVYRVNTDLVLVNVTVLDGQGKFVNKLKPADFSVSENGQAQTVSSFTAQETPFAAAILLDTSGSMESRLSLGRSAAIRFLDGLRAEDVASVYRFDAKVERLHEALGGLPERQRIAVVLFDAEGYGHADIAEILGVPEGTVRSYVFHARRALRRALGAFKEGG